MSDTSNEAIVRRAIEAIWNAGDLDVADDLFGADYVNHNGVVPDLVKGPEAVKISVAMYRLAFPNFSVDVEELSTEEDRVVLRWIARSGPTEPPPHDLRTSDQRLVAGVTRSRVAGGKILESWTEWDLFRVLSDLGLISTD